MHSNMLRRGVSGHHTSEAGMGTISIVPVGGAGRP